MTTTTNLSITLLEQAQAQKEVTVNAALVRIDALMNTGAKDKDLATPPGSPAAGDVYIIAASPTGAWSGQAGKITFYDTTWRFITPREGMTLWVQDENVYYGYDGAAWRPSVRHLVLTGALTDGATINWDVQSIQHANVTLGGNRALANPTNMQNGGFYRLVVRQDATGSRTLSYGSAYKWPAASVPTLSTGANAVDIFRFYCDGTNMFGVCEKNFS